jgi:hypothetical protein
LCNFRVAAGIMDMMKDMYDSGDETMKKAIGEAMVNVIYAFFIFA